MGDAALDQSDNTLEEKVHQHYIAYLRKSLICSISSHDALKGQGEIQIKGDPIFEKGDKVSILGTEYQITSIENKTIILDKPLIQLVECNTMIEVTNRRKVIDEPTDPLQERIDLEKRQKISENYYWYYNGIA